MTIGAPQIISNFGPANFRLTLPAAMIRKPCPAILLPPGGVAAYPPGPSATITVKYIVSFLKLLFCHMFHNHPGRHIAPDDYPVRSYQADLRGGSYNIPVLCSDRVVSVHSCRPLFRQIFHMLPP